MPLASPPASPPLLSSDTAALPSPLPRPLAAVDPAELLPDPPSSSNRVELLLSTASFTRASPPLRMAAEDVDAELLSSASTTRASPPLRMKAEDVDAALLATASTTRASPPLLVAAENIHAELLSAASTSTASPPILVAAEDVHVEPLLSASTSTASPPLLVAAEDVHVEPLLSTAFTSTASPPLLVAAEDVHVEPLLSSSTSTASPPLLVAAEDVHVEPLLSTAFTSTASPPLLVAAEDVHAELLSTASTSTASPPLLSFGAEVNALRADGWRPLHAAARAGDVRLARRLLEARADAALRCRSGKLPWQLACANGDRPMMELLLGGARARGAVLLHVYDLGTDEKMRSLNALMMAVGGGCFHTAIEVEPLSEGLEWSYGLTEDEGSGVFSCDARGSRDHQYRETVVLGRTSMRQAEWEGLLERMSAEWRGCDYHLVKRNCQTFCEELSARLGTAALPDHIRRFAKIGAGGLDVARGVARCFRQLSPSSSRQSSLGDLSRDSSRKLAVSCRRSKSEGSASGAACDSRGWSALCPSARPAAPAESETASGLAIVGFSDAKGFTEYLISGTTSSGAVVRIAHRYSDFLALHSAIFQELELSSRFPCAKEPFAFFRSSVKQSRVLQLSAYLDMVIRHSPRPFPRRLAEFMGLASEPVHPST
ncbi:hypothetical protein AB1Y20_021767 [Prymnesium parvum]|uniref:PPPDE domain-containing protein n=1 Tax=Prymnesium parvum TaxID=97485 RepID=A0AB34JJN3_PRYPA